MEKLKVAGNICIQYKGLKQLEIKNQDKKPGFHLDIGCILTNAMFLILLKHYKIAHFRTKALFGQSKPVVGKFGGARHKKYAAAKVLWLPP